MSNMQEQYLKIMYDMPQYWLSVWDEVLLDSEDNNYYYVCLPWKNWTEIINIPKIVSYNTGYIVNRTNRFLLSDLQLKLIDYFYWSKHIRSYPIFVKMIDNYNQWLKTANLTIWKKYECVWINSDYKTIMVIDNFWKQKVWPIDNFELAE